MNLKLLLLISKILYTIKIKLNSSLSLLERIEIFIIFII